MVTYAPTTLTASTTLSIARHGDGAIRFNNVAGGTLTLPASAGTGARFRIFNAATITSNSFIVKVANSTDVMRGVCVVAQDGGDTSVLFETASTSDTITMNGTTTGGVAGDYIDVEDMSTGFWRVNMVVSATGTEATPFSATV